jgi:hypothetical protein
MTCRDGVAALVVGHPLFVQQSPPGVLDGWLAHRASLLG